MLLACSASRAFLQLLKTLDQMSSGLILPKRLYACVFAMILHILCVAATSTYFVYTLECDVSVSQQIADFRQRYLPNLPASHVEVIFRAYTVFTCLPFVSREILLGFVLSVMFLTSETLRMTAVLMNSGLLTANTVPIHEYSQMIQLRNVVKDLNGCFSPIVGILCYGALTGSIVLTLDCSQYTTGQQPPMENIAALMTHIFSFCALTSICAFSTEQGQKLANVAEMCLRIGEKQWTNDEWTATYLRGKQSEPCCYTAGGVVIMREGAVQACAALISTLLVFAELAGGGKSEGAGKGGANTTQVI
ncbi:uncharacterized protein LOC129592568 [Paramacrobiotus metropolitanus]|uniref:uncharacterized protein LOC129592568 n=1 Tax=Paramacrobiotus metropolitanus TaxID=2943436 RepID=UPI0024464E1E|nr:uncharacterized protein LOC129592568 [Paramacrobiotus metropolitanus]